jgi:hypothetical protein
MPVLNHAKPRLRQYRHFQCGTIQRRPTGRTQVACDLMNLFVVAPLTQPTSCAKQTFCLARMQISDRSHT